MTPQPTHPPKGLGATLRAARQRYELTPQDVAEAAHMPLDVIERIEAGTLLPTHDRDLEQLALAYHLPLYMLYYLTWRLPPVCRSLDADRPAIRAAYAAFLAVVRGGPLE